MWGQWILGWQSVAFHPWVTVTLTLTSDLVFRICSFVHIFYILWGRDSTFGVWMHLGMVECRVPFSGQGDFDLWPTLRIIVSGAYLLYYLRLESQIWFVDKPWDGGVSCTIYGLQWLWLLTYFLELSCPWYISFTFKLGITNLLCGCILGWRSVIYQFMGHCDIDFVSKIIVSGAYLLYYLRQESQIWCVVASWDGRVSCFSFGVTVTLNSFLE